MARKIILLFVVAAMVVGIYDAMHRPGSNHVSSVSKLRVAPDLSVTDLNGDALHTSNYKGKVVLVNFWAAWCTSCADEVPQFIALQKKYHDQGLQVIGFSVEDDAGELRDFYRKYQMNYPVAPSDPKIADGFGGVLGLPTTFLIGKDNLIHIKHNGTTDFSVIEREVIALLHAPQS